MNYNSSIVNLLLKRYKYEEIAKYIRLSLDDEIKKDEINNNTTVEDKNGSSF